MDEEIVLSEGIPLPYYAASGLSFHLIWWSLYLSFLVLIAPNQYVRRVYIDILAQITANLSTASNNSRYNMDEINATFAHLDQGDKIAVGELIILI